MTELYIANSQKRHLDFMVNILESGRRHIKTVPMFEQSLYGDFSDDEINSIVSQHKKYGMSADTALSNNVGTSVIPYIYSLDDPVSDADFKALIENNYLVYSYGTGAPKRLAA